MIFVFLSAACSVLLAHFLKSTETRKLSTINVLTVNYFVAIWVALGMNLAEGNSVIPEFPLWFWIFALVTGVLFIANFFIFSKSVDRNGMGVTIAAMRVSLLVPILLSVIVYGELMTPLKIGGILLVFTAMFLFVLARRDLKLTRVNSHILLIALFGITGIVDSSMKVFEREMLGVATEAHFMTVLFVVAFVTGLIVSGSRGSLRHLNGLEIRYGALVGIPNLLSSIFLIKALAVMDASAAYSLVNLLVIAGGTLIGLILWKDRIAPKDWFGLLFALSAILLLSRY